MPEPPIPMEVKGSGPTENEEGGYLALDIVKLDRMLSQHERPFCTDTLPAGLFRGPRLAWLWNGGELIPKASPR